MRSSRAVLVTTVFLKAGYALYRVGNDAIRIGSGAMEAHYVADAQ